MRLRHIPQAAEAVLGCELVFDQARAPGCQGRWQEIFGNKQPIHLEIGMGRGRFLLASALAHPELNFIGAELREEMIMQALERVAELPANIRFLWLNAAMLTEVFGQGEVAKIYLNFPDPWPKKRHAKRRLNADAYLRQYREILADDGSLRLKTDNPEFFAWSKECFASDSWELINRSDDLPLSEAEIVSEYEARYRRLERPIYFGEWRK
jgi:tRNA (guanine-N7-)-methyltransferase